MRFTKGLNRDVDPSAQPEGTYRILTNGIVTDDQGTIQIEDGTEIVETLTGTIKGDIILSDNRIILFIDTGNSYQIRSFNGTTTSIIDTNVDYNFGDVVGTHTVNDQGETIIYWTDGVNPPRFLNINDVDYNNLNELNLFPEYNTEEINFTLNNVFSTGGSLLAGSYYLAFAYIDEDDTLTDYFLVTDPISITQGSYGADQETETGKSINFSISGLDTNYDRLRVSSIYNTQVSNVIDLDITSSSLTYTYTGNEGDIAGSLDEVVINSPQYSTATALEQHDNSLYLGGLTEKELTRDQKEHLQDQALNSTVSAIYDQKTDPRFFEDPKNIFVNRSFKRGEVYALYLSFIREDGRETEAFHIPGRQQTEGSGAKATSSIEFTGLTYPSANASTDTVGGSMPSVSDQDGDFATGEGFVFTGTPSSDTTLFWEIEGPNGSILQSGSATADATDPQTSASNFVSDITASTSGTAIEFDGQVGGVDSRQVNIIASSVGSDHNGYTLRLAQAYPGYMLELENETDGGIDTTGNPPIYNVTFNLRSEDNIPASTTERDEINTVNATFNAQDVLDTLATANIAYADPIGTIMDKVAEAINNHNNITSETYGLDKYYTATYDGGNTELTITADNNGVQYDVEVTFENPRTSSHTMNVYGGYTAGDQVLYEVQLANGEPVEQFTFDENNETTIDDLDDEFVQDVVDPLFNITANVDSNTSKLRIEYDELTTAVNGQSPSLSSAGATFGGGIITTTIVKYGGTGETLGVAGGETQNISSAHPLYQFTDGGSNPISIYQIRFESADESMAYWENKNETYPTVEPFISNGLDGQPVRHHAFSGFVFDDHPVNPSGEDINITGFTLDIPQLDTNIVDDIVGYKLYYAEKDQSNRISLGQSSFNHGWLDRQPTSTTTSSDGYKGARPHQQYDAVFNEDILVTHGFDELSQYDVGNGFQPAVEWGSDSTFAYGRIPELLLEESDISGAQYIRRNYITENDHQEIDQESIQTNTTSSAQDEVRISALKAKAYVSANQRNINLTNLGFSYDMDNLFGESKLVLELDGDELCERGERVNLDICQILSDVHVPFTNQKLVWTGYTGQIDSNGDQVSPSDQIFGGDTYISENYYRANTLLALAEERAWTEDKGENDADNAWWGRNFGPIEKVTDTTNAVPNNNSYPESPMANYYLKEVGENYLFIDNIDYADALSIEQATLEVIGSTASIRSLPYGFSTLYRDVIESRVNTNLFYSGDPDSESVYPQNTNWVARPYPPASIEIDGLGQGENAYQFTRWWQEFFTDWDNYYNWNSLYDNVQNIKTNFPWNPNENISTNNFNRVIRSASDSEDGRSQSFRQFRENDYLDLPRNRGNITNLENVENTLLIHMDRALIYTRGREELRTQDFEVFLGNGDIFGVKPNEVLITDSGYAGCQDQLASTNCKYGYFFVDQEDNKVLWMSQNGIKDLTTKQFGLHNFFREDFDSTNCIVGYDSNRERIIISSDSHTLTFNPDLGIWSTFLDYTPNYMVRTLSTFFSFKNSRIYRHKEGLTDIYDNSITFNITYSSPTGFDSKLRFVWFNADKISSGSITEDIPFNTIRVQNSHQDTGNITLTPYSTDPDDITSRGNTRKSQGIWKINDLRISETDNRLPSWATQRRLEDDYHLVTLEYVNTDNGLIILKASNIETNPTLK